MKVIRDRYGGVETVVGLEEAFQEILDGADYERGELETIKAAIDNQAKIIGKIMFWLEKNNIIRDDIILKEFLGYGWRKAK